MRYIALLRGINVGGRNVLRMADLEGAFRSMGFAGIETYLQSGNVVFDSEMTDAPGLADGIEAAVRETAGVAANVLIRTKDELARVIRDNPFHGRSAMEPDKFFVTFLSEAPDKGTPDRLEMKKEASEKLVILGREAYLYCPNGYSRTKLNNTALEKKLKRVATTRNWNTVNELLAMAGRDAL